MKSKWRKFFYFNDGEVDSVEIEAPWWFLRDQARKNKICPGIVANSDHFADSIEGTVLTDVAVQFRI